MTMPGLLLRLKASPMITDLLVPHTSGAAPFHPGTAMDRNRSGTVRQREIFHLKKRGHGPPERSVNRTARTVRTVRTGLCESIPSN